ncbi:MAG TPA: hypothetical protein VKC33_04855, partial [Burkholderiales bacterium]|nr:hypothetical protein [Burkholderiales bacterium]
MHNPAVSSLGSEYRRDKNRRFSIPDGLIEKAAWPNGQTLELVAEAMESGRIKLHLADSIKTALEARKQELERS